MSAELAFDILARDRASQTFNNVGNAASGVGTKFLSFGKVAAGALAGAGVAAVGMGVKVAAANEQARIAFTTMLGSAQKANSFLKQLQQFAAATPFEFPELQTAASSLISVGINANRVIPIMRTLGNVTSGMGTGSEGIQRATVALQQMNAAQAIHAEDLNQLRDAGIPVYDLLSSALGKSKAEVVALAQSGKLGKDALDKMMGALESGKGLERFNGLMQKQSQSLTGMWSTLKDTFSMGMANAIEPLLPLLKEGLGGATAVLAKTTPAVATGIRSLMSSLSGLGSAGGPVIDMFSRIGDAFRVLFGDGSLDQRLDRFADELDYAFGNTGKLAEPLGVAFGAIYDSVSQLLPVFTQIGQSIASNFLPVLQQVGQFIGTQLLPAVLSLWSYLAQQLTPVFVQIGQIISTQVVPILASFGQFLSGTVYPALLQIYQAVGQQLRPVFDALVQTFRANILPALEQLLAKFREWQPTIQRVAAVVLQITGKLLEFAAAIVGRVLPPAIKFAGWLIGNLVPAIGTAIGFVVKIVGAVLDFGSKLVDAGNKAGQFAKKVLDKIGGIPGAVKGFFNDARTWLLNAGEQIINGLVDGIMKYPKKLAGALGGIGGFIKDHKGPPEADRVMLVPAGRMIIDGLVDGILSGEGNLKKALDRITGKIQDAGQRLKDALSAKSDFVAGFQSFATSLFSAPAPTDADGNQGTPTAASLLAFEKAQRAQAAQLRGDIAKLVHNGLSPELIKQMQSSTGGVANIHALAGASAAQIKQFNALNTATAADLKAAGLTAAKGAGFDDDIKQARRDKALAQAVGDAVGKALKNHSQRIVVELDSRVIYDRLATESQRQSRRHDDNGLSH